MKRRSFIKYLAALPGLGFLGKEVLAEPLDTSSMIQGSIPCDPYSTDKEAWYIKDDARAKELAMAARMTRERMAARIFINARN